MASPLDKVLDLIALAVDESSSQEEARNAAMTAVKLIDKHGLLVSSMEVRKLRRSSGVVMDRKVQRIAEEYVSKTVSDLVNKSIIGAYPRITAWRLTEEAADLHRITQDQKWLFQKHVRAILTEKVRRGLLVSKSGWQGGYQLARTKGD